MPSEPFKMEVNPIFCNYQLITRERDEKHLCLAKRALLCLTALYRIL